VSETLRCPHCGSPVRTAVLPGDNGDRAGPPDRGLDPLYREVRRIREIAESRSAAAAGGGRRVAELTREVEELRATVARLRGSAMAGPSR
jgi:hypothetical protein